MTDVPLLRMEHIRKEYPGVVALSDVDFELRAGEVHCLCGENGAGKSTLMKILSGALALDAGSLLIDGKKTQIESPADAQQCGIGMIHQDVQLVPELTVAENIFLGNEPHGGMLGFVDFGKMEKDASSLLNQLGEQIDPSARVRDLRVAQRQIVEIAKALSRNVRILAMDEPSASLTANELKNLFEVILRLKRDGVGVVYISHRLEEIFEIGDRLTVLRDGKYIHSCGVAEADRRSLVRWMVGREIEQEYPRPVLERGNEILRVEHLSAGMLKDINCCVYRGEIFGLAGLVGAGRSEFARVLFGADPFDAGTITLDGKQFQPGSPRDAIDAGIGLLTEDRNKYGLIMQMNVRENISLSNLRELVKGMFVDRKRESDAANRFSEELRIKTPTIEQNVESLSGGNRQKVVLARWLFTKSKILIFDEPTAGIDVGVKLEIYNLMIRLAEQGTGVVVISSDLPELLGISNRVGVMFEGRLAGILSREEATQENVMTLATGGVLEHPHGR